MTIVTNPDLTALAMRPVDGGVERPPLVRGPAELRRTLRALMAECADVRAGAGTHVEIARVEQIIERGHRG